jgi:hypothetical protein
MGTVKGTESFSKSFIEVFERATLGSNTWNEVASQTRVPLPLAGTMLMSSN